MSTASGFTPNVAGACGVDQSKPPASSLADPNWVEILSGCSVISLTTSA
jgi:hypothetical protein